MEAGRAEEEHRIPGSLKEELIVNRHQPPHVRSEFALLIGTDTELRKLERTRSTIQDVLEDAEARQVKERALRSWLRKLKDLAYDADDVLDHFANKVVEFKLGIEANLKDKVLICFSIPKNIVFQRKLSLRVKEINHRLDEVNRINHAINTGSKFCQMNMDKMQVSLTEQLKEQKFLLVLEDVWNEIQARWDRLRSLLAVGGQGSKILVTTGVRVASIMGKVSQYRLSNLPLNDCWLVFERRAFAMEVERNPNLVEIGREIVKKCGGVSLTAKALGSLLRFKRTESGWLAIRDSELWELSGDEN
ncbi:putative disease resistance protein RGA3 [Platanthera guangdongensis]|uniref:Disease resistance protein RGA3 n=1 Tax=Platanthera guangdongensis TaxID=2320717 RepID=A0ABR2M5T7_9ASPA